MEFIAKHNELYASLNTQGRCLGQCQEEFLAFLEYASAFFLHRGIARPLVVEIGTLDNAQKTFYEGLLGAEHIGIDIKRSGKGPADIVGDSRDPGTLFWLKERLVGRPIDLLFLDGNHAYDYVKYEYEHYGPLVRHLIAFHDLLCTNEATVEVNKFWAELTGHEGLGTFLTFYRPRMSDRNGIWDGHEMGIGVLVKK